MRKVTKDEGITLIALVITIIVLLILAGVSIATLSGDNGVLSRANQAKENTKMGEVKEIVDIILQEWKIEKIVGTDSEFEEFLKSKVPNELDYVVKEGEIYIAEKDGYEAKITVDGKIDGEIVKIEGIRPRVEINLYQENGNPIDETVGYDKVILTVKVTNKDEINKVKGKIDEIIVKNSTGTKMKPEAIVVGDGEKSFKVDSAETYTITVKATANGITKEIVEIKVAGRVPLYWKIVDKEDETWYAYTDIGTNTKAKVNAPKLKGQMAPIKYIDEEQSGSKWANAITADGSMWVWIPRYAYKITEGYHSSTAGTIEVAFINTRNQFLNGETGAITENPAEEGAGITKWLVHPAFTPNVENGGGFGNLEGLWVGKFEATGTNTNIDVKPGKAALTSVTVNEQFKGAINARYKEKVNMESHMAKNSEWGATAYMAHSKYGINRLKVEQQTTGYITGGTSIRKDIYIVNKMQSTTHNATGIYDLNGGSTERVASYVNNDTNHLIINGGINKGDLYGEDQAERGKSTKYKTVYPSIKNVVADYEKAKIFKGDSVYEISNSHYSSIGSWFNMEAFFPNQNNSFFCHGGNRYYSNAGIFWFAGNDGGAYGYNAFRSVLAF